MAEVREVFSADQYVQGPIPDIRKDARSWFLYYDHDDDKRLSKVEVLQALVDTLMSSIGYSGEAPDIDTLRETLDALWEVYGLGDGGLVSMENFVSPGGLAESIISSLPPLPATMSIDAAPSQSFVPSHHPTATRTILVACGNCRSKTSSQLPLATITLISEVRCCVCGILNRISVAPAPVPPPPPAPDLDPVHILPAPQETVMSHDSASLTSVPASASASARTHTFPTLQVRRVFVLSPGRCGMQTFVAACKWLENFEVMLESNTGKPSMLGSLDYPAGCIEVDSALVGRLGPLSRLYRREEEAGAVLYVMLRRDPAAVADSQFRCLRAGLQCGEGVRAFISGTLLPGSKAELSEEQQRNACELYVDTVYANIAEFAASRSSRFMTVDLEGDDGESFSRFLERIGARGDLDASRREFLSVHDDRGPAGPAAASGGADSWGGGSGGSSGGNSSSDK